MSALESFDSRPLSDRLVESVREIILSGEMSPDEPIRQDSLAARLHVSKIPLREALSRLVQDGLVISQPNRGFFVQPMTFEEAEEIFTLRLKLEPDAAATACTKATATARDHARHMLAAYDQASSVQDGASLHRAFHMALMTPGAGSVTVSTLTRLHVLADRYVRRYLDRDGREPVADRQHHELLEVWLNGEVNHVRTLATDHLEHTLRDLRRELGAPD